MRGFPFVPILPIRSNVNNHIAGMLQNLFPSHRRSVNPLDEALELDSLWKDRAYKWVTQAQNLITKKETLISQLCGEEETLESIEKIDMFFVESIQLREQIDEVNKWASQREPLELFQIEKISSLEVEMYKSLMEPLRKKILDAQEHHREIQRLANEMFENIENMWDSGKPEIEISQYIKESLRRIYPNSPDTFIEQFSVQTLQMGTAHLSERIRLTQEQIDNISTITVVDPVDADYKCATCLEQFVANECIKVLPCDSRHVFHCDCINPWFERRTTCPLCKKDMRDLIEESAQLNNSIDNEGEHEPGDDGDGDNTSVDTQQQMGSINRNRETQERIRETQERQNALLNQFLNSFTESLRSLINEPIFEQDLRVEGNEGLGDEELQDRYDDIFQDDSRYEEQLQRNYYVHPPSNSNQSPPRPTPPENTSNSTCALVSDEEDTTSHTPSTSSTSTPESHHEEKL
jgi:hypothetical protein